jgi:hypothetical protein
MPKTIQGSAYHLQGRTKIWEVGENHIALVKERKTRMVKKDAETIIEQIGLIRENNPHLKVSLATSAPLCSKSQTLLQEAQIEIIALSNF